MYTFSLWLLSFNAMLEEEGARTWFCFLWRNLLHILLWLDFGFLLSSWLSQ